MINIQTIKKYERIITKENTFNTYENFKAEFKRIEQKKKDCKGKIRCTPFGT